MRRTFVLLTALSLVAMAGLATVVEAKEDRPDRPDRAERGEPREMREQRAEKWKERFTFGNASLSLSGSAVDKQNNTYSFTVDGPGQVLEAYKNGTMMGFRGVIKAHVVLKDANGTVLKEGDLRLKVRGHQNETGEWKWKAVSFMHRGSDMPKIVMRGTADLSEPGSFDLEGKGHAVVRLGDDERKTPLKLSDIEGTLTVPVRA